MCCSVVNRRSTFIPSDEINKVIIEIYQAAIIALLTQQHRESEYADLCAGV
jgi:hypothetical protein